MKKETVKEVAERFWRNDETMSDYVQQAYITGFIAGSKWQQEQDRELEKEIRMYSEKDMKECWNASYIDAMSLDEITYKPLFFEDYIEKIKNETK